MGNPRTVTKLLLAVVLLQTQVGCMETVADITHDEQNGVDRSEVRDAFVEKVNEFRRRNDMVPVAPSDSLNDMARSHSESMAEYEYVGHSEPGEGGFSERLRKAEVGDDCGLRAKEFLAKVDLNKTVLRPNARLRKDANESEIATWLFKYWRNQGGFTDYRYIQDWRSIGLGLYVTGEKILYATAVIC